MSRKNLKTTIAEAKAHPNAPLMSTTQTIKQKRYERVEDIAGDFYNEIRLLMVGRKFENW
jgi:hypothetical protein